jgi:hypothetical protein
MWRSKKFIIVAVLAVVALVGSIGGVAIAQSENSDENHPGAGQAALLEKVCEIYEDNTGTAIEADELQEAFAQARDEMQAEALDEHLQSLVDEGKITQEEADQYKAWLEARPEIDAQMAPGFPGAGMHRGFGGPGGFGPPSGEFEPPAAE